MGMKQELHRVYTNMNLVNLFLGHLQIQQSHNNTEWHTAAGCYLHGSLSKKHRTNAQNKYDKQAKRWRVTLLGAHTEAEVPAWRRGQHSDWSTRRNTTRLIELTRTMTLYNTSSLKVNSGSPRVFSQGRLQGDGEGLLWCMEELWLCWEKGTIMGIKNKLERLK